MMAIASTSILLVVLSAINLSSVASTVINRDDKFIPAPVFGEVPLTEVKGVEPASSHKVDEDEKMESPFVRRGNPGEASYRHKLKLDLNEVPEPDEGEPTYDDNVQGYPSTPYVHIANDQRAHQHGQPSFTQQAFHLNYQDIQRRHQQQASSYSSRPNDVGITYYHHHHRQASTSAAYDRVFSTGQNQIAYQHHPEIVPFQKSTPALDHTGVAAHYQFSNFNPVYQHHQYYTSHQEPAEPISGFRGETSYMSQTSSSATAAASSRSFQDDWQKGRRHPNDWSLQQQMQYAEQQIYQGTPVEYVPHEHAASSSAYRRSRKKPAKKIRPRKKFKLFYSRDLPPKEELEAMIPFHEVPYQRRRYYIEANILPPELVEAYQLRSEATKLGHENRKRQANKQPRLPTMRERGYLSYQLYMTGKMDEKEKEEHIARSRTWGSQRSEELQNYLVPKILITRPDQVPAEAARLIKNMNDPRERMEKLAFVYQIKNVAIPDPFFVFSQSVNLYYRWRRGELVTGQEVPNSGEDGADQVSDAESGE